MTNFSKDELKSTYQPQGQEVIEGRRSIIEQILIPIVIVMVKKPTK